MGAMDVLITSAYPDAQPVTAFREMAARDRFGVHHVTEDAAAAGMILFVENSHYDDDGFFRVLRRHPLVRAYPEKTFMYNEHDRPYCALPGVYCSMPAPWFDRRRQRATGYLLGPNPLVGEARLNTAPDLLFSFAGRRNAPVRSRILALRHPAAHLADTTHLDAYVHLKDRRDEARSYVELLGRSRFVICPRGVGTGSVRLFETLQAGRVPVIVSDDWVEPDGPRWDQLSLRVRESEIERIPALLEEHDARWGEMARAARAAWEAWFAPEVRFHRMVESCQEIARARTRPEAAVNRIPRPLLLYARYRARAAARRVALRLGRAG